MRIDILQKLIIDTLPPSKVKIAHRADIVYIKDFFVLKHLLFSNILELQDILIKGLLDGQTKQLGRNTIRLGTGQAGQGGPRLPGRCYISVAGLGDNIEYSAQKPWNICVSKYLFFVSKLIIGCLSAAAVNVWAKLISLQCNSQERSH